MIKDIDIAVNAAEYLLARTHGEDSNISQAMHTLIVAGWQCTIDDEAALCIVRVYEVIVFVEACNVRGRFLDTISTLCTSSEEIADLTLGPSLCTW